MGNQLKEDFYSGVISKILESEQELIAGIKKSLGNQQLRSRSMLSKTSTNFRPSQDRLSQEYQPNHTDGGDGVITP